MESDYEVRPGYRDEIYSNKEYISSMFQKKIVKIRVSIICFFPLLVLLKVFQTGFDSI